MDIVEDTHSIIIPLDTPYILPEEEFEEIRQIFIGLSGESRLNKISIDHAGTALRLLGYNPSERDIGLLNAEVDPSNSGYFKIEKFYDLFSNYKFELDSEYILKKALQSFDHDADGKLHIDDLKNALLQLSEQLSEDEFNAVIEQNNLIQDGFIDIEELCEFIFNGNLTID